MRRPVTAAVNAFCVSLRGRPNILGIEVAQHVVQDDKIVRIHGNDCICAVLRCCREDRLEIREEAVAGFDRIIRAGTG